MKRILLSLLFVAITLTSCAATWTMQCHAPTQDNLAVCGTPPVLVPTVGGLVKVRLAWSMPPNATVLGRDSLTVQPGVLCLFPRNGPSGQYLFTAVAVDSLGNWCGVDSALVTVRGGFAAIIDLGVK